MGYGPGGEGYFYIKLSRYLMNFNFLFSEMKFFSQLALLLAHAAM